MTATGGDFAAPANEAVAVTPSDTVALAVPSRALYVGGAGNVAVVMAGPGASLGEGVAVTFTNVPAGAILPISVLRVNNTNTTATSIVSLY